MIICKTPFRVSFFGGGTDMPKWLSKNDGQVINASINKFGYIYFTKKDDIYNYKYKIRYYLNEEAKNINSIKHPVVKKCLKYYKLSNQTLHITYDSDLPARSGLGSSSSFTTGLLNSINFFKKNKISKKELAKQSIYVEQNLLKETVGMQDQIAASFGGLNHIKFKKNDFSVNKINLNKDKFQQLNESILLCYTGQQRTSHKIEEIKYSRMSDNINIYKEIDSITNEGLSLLHSKNDSWLKYFGNLLNDYWILKRSLDKHVSNELIDTMHSKFIEEGAYGVKLMGAGNGGFMLIIADNGIQQKIVNKYKKFKFIKIMIESFGSKIIFPN
jgi:D-glycero-alpha-D-manno-heptose-7-phosphate kinase